MRIQHRVGSIRCSCVDTWPKCVCVCIHIFSGAHFMSSTCKRGFALIVFVHYKVAKHTKYARWNVEPYTGKRGSVAVYFYFVPPGSRVYFIPSPTEISYPLRAIKHRFTICMVISMDHYLDYRVACELPHMSRPSSYCAGAKAGEWEDLCACAPSKWNTTWPATLKCPNTLLSLSTRFNIEIRDRFRTRFVTKCVSVMFMSQKLPDF